MFNVDIKKMMDKIEDDVGYVSLRRRMSRCFLLKLEVVMTLMVMMTMMVMMAIQNREETSEPNEQGHHSDYNLEDNTDEYEEEFLVNDEESEDDENQTENEDSRMAEERNYVFWSGPIFDRIPC